MSKKKTSSQKFIGRNRAPRVQIDYDVELLGSKQKKELPFVMGVMSDLSGKQIKSEKLTKRKFLEFDCENFDDRMAKIKPKVEFRVPNTLTGEGDLSIDMEFESMDDFTPGKIAEKVDALSQLMNARKELSNLMSYMDGKADAEDLINEVLNNPELLKSLAATPKEVKETGVETTVSNENPSEKTE